MMKAAAVMLGFLLLAGCTREQAREELESVKRAKDVARRASAHADTSSADESFGVAECDDYVKKVNSCIDEKVPADQQGSQRFQLDSQKRKWAEMAKDPVQKEMLGTECRSAASLAQSSLASFGCEF